MAFSDVINDYSLGATGTLTDADGQSVTYTVTDGAQTIDINNHGDDSAKIGAQGQDTVTVTFDEPVVGASVTFQGSNSDEFYQVMVDGEAVNLYDLIESGDVTFANVGSSSMHSISEDGTISGGYHTDGSIGNLVFNFPVTSIGVVGAGGPSSGNYDGIEVGIDSGVFNVVCFVNGTTILTSTGPEIIENLQVGDLLSTVNGTDKPIRWIGSRRITRSTLRKRKRLRPIRIAAGALGQGLPLKDLLVSHQHRILISSKIAKNMFGVADVLIPAIKLIDLPGIDIDNSSDEVTYFHVALDEHDVIFAQGAPAETLHLGLQGLKAMPTEAREELLSIFPEFSDQLQELAEFVPTGRDQKKLVARHIKKERPLLEAFVLKAP
jgi:hypothetical protein